ncbi:MAG: oligosaccharide flippase family protein [Thermoplasmatales archaeon]|nr:oligosaccharide flippase family protein [Thermoplasmatales archaeon]
MEKPAIREEISGGIFLQYVKSFVGFISGFVFYLFIIHFYSSLLVGIVALLLAVANLMNMLFSLGLGAGLQHFISYHLGRDEYGGVREMVVKFLLTGFSLAMLSLLLVMYSTSGVFAMLFFHSPAYVPLLRCLSIYLMFMVFGSFLGGTMIGLQNFRSEARWRIGGILISYSSALLLLFLFNNSISIVIGWIAGSVFSNVAFLLIIISRMRNIRVDVGGGVEIAPVFRYSFPIFLASLVGIGSTYVDRFVVSYLLNLSLPGIYNFALLISSAIGFIVGPFTTILLPKLSEMYGLNK